MNYRIVVVNSYSLLPPLFSSLAEGFAVDESAYRIPIVIVHFVNQPIRLASPGLSGCLITMPLNQHGLKWENNYYNIDFPYIRKLR